MLGYSISQHGRQPALWTHQYGKGRVIGITPGHTYENLGQPEYLKLKLSILLDNFFSKIFEIFLM